MSFMNHIIKKIKPFYFPLSLLLILSFSRLLPHPNNFTPIIAISIMAPYFFKNIYTSVVVIIFAMFISDIFLGFHETILTVYFSLLLICLIFYRFSSRFNLKNLYIYSISGSLIFFFISNFGVWLFQDLYEKNINGLISCYIYGIPFFKNTLISTLFFSYLSLTSDYIYKKKFA